jgi:hypothetical protein
MRNIFFFLCTLFIIFNATSVFAQEGYEHLSLTAHGAGRTYVVTSRGLSAVGLNPALLGYENSNTLEIQIFPLSAYGLDAGPSFSDASALADVFNFKNGQISDSTRKHISAVLSDGKLSGRGDAEILGVSYHLPTVGTFAFTWTTHAALRTDIPQEFLDFFINAESQLVNADEGKTYSNFDLQGMWYNEYSASFGTSIFRSPDTSSFINSFYIGGAAKYISGIGYLQLDPTNYFSFRPDNGFTNIGVNYVVRSAYGEGFDPKHVPNHFSFDFLTSNQSGSGFGTDLGVAVGFLGTKSGNSIVLLGLSVTDIGTISWSTNATERIADHLSRDIHTSTTINALNDSLKALGGTLRRITSFTSPLPAMFRAGLQFDLDAMGIEWGVFIPKIALEYATGLTDIVGSLKSGRLGAGLTLEKRGPIGLRINGGFVLESNATDFTLGVGISPLKFLSIDIASSHIGQFFKSGSSRTDLALGIRASF